MPARVQAHWALTLGLKCGDIVALLMTNRPEFVAVWYGLAKVGVIASFINTNLSGELNSLHCSHVVKDLCLAHNYTNAPLRLFPGPPLTHSITVCTPRAIVFEESLRGSLTRVWTNVQEVIASLNSLSSPALAFRSPIL